MERTENRQSENEQTKVAAHTAEAEHESGAAAIGVSLGKFKDVASLLKAYENLESEFTRRSRRLKELEGKVSKGEEEITRRGASSSAGKDLGGNKSDCFSDDGERRENGGNTDCREEKPNENEGKADALSDETERAAKSDKTEIREANKKNAEKEGGELENEGLSVKNDYSEMEEIVKKYLLGVMRSRPPVTPTVGAAVAAPPRKPKTFEEAGMLIKNGFEL